MLMYCNSLDLLFRRNAIVIRKGHELMWNVINYITNYILFFFFYYNINYNEKNIITITITNYNF